MNRARNVNRILSGAGVAAPVILALAGGANASISPNLGTAGDYAVLGVNQTTMSLTGGASWVTSNLGVGPNSSLNFSGGGFVLGRIDQNPGSSVMVSGGSTVLGGLNGTSMSQPYLDAVSASAAAAGNSPSQSFANILSSQTINGLSGMNVVAFSGSITLSSGSTLTLSAPSTGYFVVNVLGGLSLAGGSQIALSGGITADHVMFNMQTTGTGPVDINTGSVMNGTILALNRDINLSASTVRGQVIGADAHNMTLINSPTVTYMAFQSPPVPGPQTAVLLGGVLLLGGRMRRRPV